jgi:hypothetical protein
MLRQLNGPSTQLKNTNMKKHFIKRKGMAQASSLGYLLAIMLALKPLLDQDADLSTRQDQVKFGIRIFFAMALALVNRFINTEQTTDKKENN